MDSDLWFRGMEPRPSNRSAPWPAHRLLRRALTGLLILYALGSLAVALAVAILAVSLGRLFLPARALLSWVVRLSHRVDVASVVPEQALAAFAPRPEEYQARVARFLSRHLAGVDGRPPPE